MVGLIYFIGILVIILVVVVWLEYAPEWFNFKKKKSIASALNDVEQTQDEVKMTGIRKTLKPFEGATEKYASPKLLRKTRYDLYWGQMGGKYEGWTAVSFLTLRIFIAVCAAVAATLLIRNPIYVAVAAFVGWQYPMIGLGGVARKTRRQFQGQLPEYIQLIAAQMAAGVSFDESVRRTSRAESLPALWMRKVLQMAQGRSLVDQINREAIESQLPELISTGMQLSYLNRGAAQQKLLDDLAAQISSNYTAQVNIRAEKIGAELVIPMVLFYFLPFMVSILAVIAFPILQGLF
jgi:Flp pilus assembly protein TadB